MTKSLRLYKFFALLLFCFQFGFAQEGALEHRVLSGETIFSIAKKYKVTPYDILKLNPEASKGLKTDDVLKIPDPVKGVRVKNNSDSRNAPVGTSTISYTVKQGDTKYSVAKQFNMSISELENQNPTIAGGFEVGEVLSISKNATNQKEQINAPVASKNPVTGKNTHLVLPGETYFGISRAYGISVNQLLRTNNRTTSDILVTGETLKIPGDAKPHAEDAGNTYVIKSGDTKFSLANSLNLSIAELERTNPQIVKMLVVGQTIKIPSVAANEVPETVKPAPATSQPTIPEQPVKVEPAAQIAKTEETKMEKPQEEVKSKVQEKEKVPALSKTEQKEPSQPQIEKPKETAKQTDVVKVETPVVAEKEVAPTMTAEPKEIVKPEPTPVAKDAENSAYTIYTVQPKETVYGLARTAGLSVADFLVLNPELKNAVQPGMRIKMPKGAAVAATSGTAPTRYKNLIPTATSTTSHNLLFFLPFSQKEYDSYAANGYNFENVGDEFKRNHLEFYRGANLAMDSLRKLNLDFKIEIVEAVNPKQTSKVKAFTNDIQIKDYDAVILPFYENLENDVAAMTASKKIPVITASPIAYQNNTNNLYSALPSINHQRAKVLDYMDSKNANVIVLSDMNRIEAKNFIMENSKNPEIITLKKNGGFSDDELTSKLKKNQLNFVVVESDRNSVFLNVTNILLSQLSNYKIQLAVLESALIPEVGDVSKKRYSILKMIYPSLIPPKSTENSKHFLSIYQKNNNLLPTANIMLGFDITFDSLLRLMQPQTFESSAQTDITEYTQLKFDYKKNSKGGFSNDGIYILQYDADASIREAN